MSMKRIVLLFSRCGLFTASVLCVYLFILYLNHNSLFLTGGRRFSEGTSADREIQRTLMELLNQMDGFDSLGQVGAQNMQYSKRPETLT